MQSWKESRQQKTGSVTKPRRFEPLGVMRVSSAEGRVQTSGVVVWASFFLLLFQVEKSLGEEIH